MKKEEALEEYLNCQLAIRKLMQRSEQLVNIIYKRAAYEASWFIPTTNEVIIKALSERPQSQLTIKEICSTTGLRRSQASSALQTLFRKGEVIKIKKGPKVTANCLWSISHNNKEQGNG